MMEPKSQDAGVIGMRVDAETSSEMRDFYASHYPQLVRALTIATGQREDAEELAQEAFIRLISRWDRVARYDNPQAWLRMVAFRLLSNRRRRQRLVASTPSRQSKAATSPSDAGWVVDLKRAVAQLPPTHRDVIILHYLYDMKLAEVADCLGARVGTVKSRLARARSELAVLLRDTEIPSDA
jgi:RNA polymerase sigma-70 factor (ECF subfamily)